MSEIMDSVQIGSSERQISGLCGAQEFYSRRRNNISASLSRQNLVNGSYFSAGQEIQSKRRSGSRQM